MASYRKKVQPEPLSPYESGDEEEIIQVVPTRTRPDIEHIVDYAPSETEETSISSRQPNQMRGSRPSNKRVLIDQTLLESLADACLVIKDLKDIITTLYNMKHLDFPAKFKTVKSGSWNIKKSGLIGRILLTPEGRELLLWEIKNSSKNQTNKLVTMNADLRDFQFIAGKQETVYRGDVAPSPQLWQDLLFSYGDTENKVLTTRNPDFDDSWFDNYFRATNRDRSQSEVIIDKPMTRTLDALRSAIIKDLSNPNEISHEREVAVEELLNLIAQLTTESIGFVIDTVKSEYELARKQQQEQHQEEYI